MLKNKVKILRHCHCTMCWSYDVGDKYRFSHNSRGFLGEGASNKFYRVFTAWDATNWSGDAEICIFSLNPVMQRHLAVRYPEMCSLL